MSGWRRLLEEESEHQWLSYAVFTVLVVIGAILIDFSNELSGVHEGGQMNVDGIIVDSAGDAILYQAENGMRLSYNGQDNDAAYATCLVEHEEFTFACLGNSGTIAYLQEDHLLCDENWCEFPIGQDVTVTQISGNGLALLMAIEDGTSNSLGAMWLGEANPNPIFTEHDGTMYIDVMVPTKEGWLVGGSWQSPANWLGSNPASPPMFELVISVTWDGVSAPATEIVHMGDEGRIHGLFATGDENYIATGTADTVTIENGVATSLGMQSYAAVSDGNDAVWLFGARGSTSVAIISDNEVTIEKLPDPLTFLPTYVACDDEGLISIHGTNINDEPAALSIDSNARTSFTSLRGILDLGFMLVSILILSMMAWNVTDAIRKGEVF